MTDAPRSLDDVVLCVCDVASAAEGKVTLEEVRDAIGGRAYGPLLFTAGLITMTPVSAVPGVPSVLALTVVLIAGQMLVGSDQVWLPRWLLRLKVEGSSLEKGARRARKPAQFLDRWVRPRLLLMTQGPGRKGVAVICILIGLITPPLELIPFSTAIPAATITVFGLGLTARDGAVVLLALSAGVAAISLVGWAILR
ncbi:exopolysaccharide biosynthesis protein [Phenylobacterium sp.]|uniref:exopolysaccharide biosynthesis protein n=1 Tax=Phenylobacterium sp. TaxID=1871053 RepID=UPI00272F2E0A|nr:exopolysaccharide biosynthesis protein [Phenylobacterium sp.]MDP1875544.1 exopolysaccharide biosynthesis protein [Phenylobacterium sp.]MDP3490948.1 exopolysaccharide biosynthesis protein [Phenylobacterium sp.]